MTPGTGGARGGEREREREDSKEEKKTNKSYLGINQSKTEVRRIAKGGEVSFEPIQIG